MTARHDGRHDGHCLLAAVLTAVTTAARQETAVNAKNIDHYGI